MTRPGAAVKALKPIGEPRDVRMCVQHLPQRDSRPAPRRSRVGRRIRHRVASRDNSRGDAQFFPPVARRREALKHVLKSMMTRGIKRPSLAQPIGDRGAGHRGVHTPVGSFLMPWCIDALRLDRMIRLWLNRERAELRPSWLLRNRGGVR